VLDVGLAQFLRLPIRLRVVIAVRKSQPALGRNSDHLRAVFEILRGIKKEDGVHSGPLQAGNFCHQRGNIVQSSNILQFRKQRLDPGGLDCVRIHAARVEVANLLNYRTGGSVPRLRSFFKNLMEHFLVVGIQFVEPAPARISGGNGVLCDPATIGKLEEVRARRSALVQA
jgi:hypothetical protein